MPILSIKNGAGPTLVIMAGNHGDEHEGQIAISTLARELNPADICGRLILMPMVNYPAAQAGLRTSPIDEGNLNRLFPGNAAGSPTEMIAHYIEDVLMPLTYYAFDLPYAGIVLCKRAMAQVVRGDAAFHIASNAAPRAAKT